MCVHSHEIFVTLYFSIRILPHKQNSGGFFVAVLEKKCSLRDVQNASKLCTAVREPASDGCANTTIKSVITQNISATLDTSSPSESSEQDNVTSVDTRTSEQTVTDSSSHPG